MLYVSFFSSEGWGLSAESNVSDEVPTIPNPLEVVAGRTPKTVVGLWEFLPWLREWWPSWWRLKGGPRMPQCRYSLMSFSLLYKFVSFRSKWQNGRMLQSMDAGTETLQSEQLGYEKANLKKLVIVLFIFTSLVCKDIAGSTLLTWNKPRLVNISVCFTGTGSRHSDSACRIKNKSREISLFLCCVVTEDHLFGAKEHLHRMLLLSEGRKGLVSLSYGRGQVRTWRSCHVPGPETENLVWDSPLHNDAFHKIVATLSQTFCVLATVFERCPV